MQSTQTTINELRNFIDKNKLKKLTKQNNLKSYLAFLLDWSIIFLSVAIVYNNIFLTPIALILIGSRQRALSNLVHDASHGNLFSNRKLNNFVPNILAAYPMLDSVETYRKSHLKHHRHLGSLELDPDTKSHFRYGYNDTNPKNDPAWKIYKKLILNKQSWKDSFTGNFFSLSPSTKTLVILYNTFAIVLISIGISFKFTTLLISLWIISRMTTYHAIRVFAEFLDHAGLKVGTILGFTRNLPHTGFLAAILHPHQDTYHLVHHIFPKVPHYNLHETHKDLFNSKNYSQAHHCDAYFKGQHSAMSCLEGNCHKEYRH
ncbi:MAG: fatty acid desaturase family protein [Bdellovibrionota bacterium]